MNNNPDTVSFVSIQYSVIVFWSQYLLLLSEQTYIYHNPCNLSVSYIYYHRTVVTNQCFLWKNHECVIELKNDSILLCSSFHLFVLKSNCMFLNLSLSRLVLLSTSHEKKSQPSYKKYLMFHVSCNKLSGEMDVLEKSKSTATNREPAIYWMAYYWIQFLRGHMFQPMGQVIPKTGKPLGFICSGQHISKFNGNQLGL